MYISYRTMTCLKSVFKQTAKCRSYKWIRLIPKGMSKYALGRMCKRLQNKYQWFRTRLKFSVELFNKKNATKQEEKNVLRFEIHVFSDAYFRSCLAR
jgi:hypothetical protein